MGYEIMMRPSPFPKDSRGLLVASFLSIISFLTIHNCNILPVLGEGSLLISRLSAHCCSHQPLAELAEGKRHLMATQSGLLTPNPINGCSCPAHAFCKNPPLPLMHLYCIGVP